MAENKSKRSWWKILLIVLSSLIGLILLVWLGYLGGSRLWLSEYYSLKTDLRNNPGLNDGYIPQGTTYLDDQDIFLTSGYMQDKSNSRIYSIDKENHTHFAKINKTDGSNCTYHFGGITDVGNYAYVCCGSAIGQVLIDDVLSKDSVNLIKTIDVDCTASFVFSNQVNKTETGYSATLYVGEFNDDVNYNTNHPYTNTDKETYHALLLQYHLLEENGAFTLTKEAIYSIRNNVQGFCITSSGKFVLSTSYGLSYSHFYIYEAPKTSDTRENSLPVYYLDSRYQKRDILAPSMSEDLDYYDGKVLYCTEAASNKYFFGKLLFYNQIYGLKIE